MKIEGKVALVTGGASGIGRAISQRLLEQGAKLVAILDKDEGDALSELSGTFGTERVKFMRCDLTEEAQLRKSFQEVYEVHEALDIVANNAGIMSADHVLMVKVNLIPVINGTIIANDLMTRRKRSEKGVIVNTASISGFKAYTTIPMGYTASKFGVVGVTKAFQCSSDGFSEDIRAVAICPTRVNTSMWTRNNYFSQQEGREMVEEFEQCFVSVSSVVDAFIQAVEDDTLNGAFIRVEVEGTTVIRE